ncbi:MAG TPA: hypothetical protein ENI26_04945 [Methylophaga aminisulfidivorans]|uniref:Microcin J25-processing protein McjB C-terminal domain-containing protein n=1 Tax=Methylophaga aminisulfidivorans TaxID=230105 RepID=A0A7C1ZQL6_9GAMM|nr:hypothetical protein [Methylophaga aminisulfidivorans]
MNIQGVYAAARDFRSAIEACSSSLGVSFKSFPSGACGDVTPLLGTYLIGRGFGEFQYMLGNYGSRGDDGWSSHAWLQSGDLVVDITADQFHDVSERGKRRTNPIYRSLSNSANLSVKPSGE